MIRSFLHNWQGTVLGEIIGATGRRLSVGLNRTPAYSFDLPMKNNPLLNELLEAADVSLTGRVPSDYRIVSVYRVVSGEMQLIFSGPIIMARDGVSEGDEPTASFTCTGAFWRMGTRLADNPGGDGRTESGLSVTGQRGQIAAQLIRDTNDLTGNSWLRAPDEGIAETDEIEIKNWGGFRTISQCISDLSGEGSLNGFDWAVIPRLEQDDDGLVLGEWTCAPLIGADLTSSVIFEYGIGRNNTTAAYRSRSLENFANVINHVSSGTSPYTVRSTSPASIAANGVFETVADGDLIDYGLRESWVKLNKALRAKPRRLFEITPQRSDLESTVGSIPIPLIDYAQGDQVRARIYYGERLRWDVALRVYSIDISWSETGEEKADLGLYME